MELHKGKLAIADVIWVAENCEPRVWEVLPAALIRFPAAFVGTDKLPAEFLKFVAKIQKGEIPIAEFHGIRGQDMARWANFPLRDRRTKPISQKRVMKAFRLPKSSLKKLKSFAQKNKITETEAIERLLAQL